MFILKTCVWIYLLNLTLCCETPNKGPLIPRMMKSVKQGKSMDLSYKEFYATLIFKHSDWLFKFL